MKLQRFREIDPRKSICVRENLYAKLLFTEYFIVKFL